MNVNQLIALLQTMPQDAQVAFCADHNDAAIVIGTVATAEISNQEIADAYCLEVGSYVLLG